jgi:phosphatidylglycerophosphate synthase
MKSIPIGLIYTRLILGFLILLLSVLQISSFNVWAIVLFSVGLLTDIFDGIIARKLNVSTQKLRRLDSIVDQIFFVLIVVAIYIQDAVFFKDNLLKIIVLLSFEALTYLVCFLKFKKEVATHSLGAKLWTLFLFATLVELLANQQANLFFVWCFWIGIITRLEITAIIFTLRKWTNDVPTIYHAFQLRNGKMIKRNKLFNG